MLTLNVVNLEKLCFSLLSVSLEMFVMHYCNNVIFDLDRTQASGREDEDSGKQAQS